MTLFMMWLVGIVYFVTAVAAFWVFDEYSFYEDATNVILSIIWPVVFMLFMVYTYAAFLGLGLKRIKEKVKGEGKGY